MLNKTVLLLETVSDEAQALLDQHVQVLMAPSPAEGGSIAGKEPIHAIITRGKGEVNEELLLLCPQLEVVARCGVGLDNVNVQAATRQRVKVVFAPGSNADTVAEHTLALMLCLQRNLYNTATAVKNGNWQYRNQYQGDEIRGKKLGIIGMGHTGQKVAKLAAVFGMEIAYWSRTDQGLPYQALSLDELLRTSDIVSLHLPLTNQTRHLIDTAAFKKMQPHALLVNTARGAVIDQKALTEALQTGTIGGFAADVLDGQPPAADDPLLTFPNVLITPHAASLTARTFNEMCVTTVQNVLDLLSGKNVDNRFIFNHLQF